MSTRLKTALTVFGFLVLPAAFLTVALYPTVTMVRENARSASCQNNLRRLGTAFLQYSQDNDGGMPNVADADGTRTWRDAALPYVKLKETYQCPARRDDVGAGGFPLSYAANDSGGYGGGALASPGAPARMRADYPDPAKLILLLEAEHNNRPDFNMDDAVFFGPQTHKMWFGHFKVHGEFLMADGHVKSLMPANTYQYDPKNHTLFNLWYRNGDTRLSANGVAALKDAERRFKW